MTIKGLLSCFKLINKDFISLNAYRFGAAQSKNGWIYLSKPFDKKGCNTNKGSEFNDPGFGDIPSIGDCVGQGAHFGDPVFDNNYCKISVDIEKPKGVMCTV